MSPGNTESVELSTVQQEQYTRFKMPNFDKHAKTIRGKIHIIFYGVGVLAQQYTWKIILFSVVLQALLCVLGIKHIKFEKDSRDAWVTTSGRIQKEMAYTREQIGDSDFGKAGTDAEYIIQISKDEKENILTKKSLMEHLELMKTIVNIKINLFDREWGLEDFCHSFDISEDILELSMEGNEIIEKLIPCLISTPLDCFWEGSYLVPREKNTQLFSWKKHRPIDVIQNDTDYFSPPVEEFIRKIGAEDGYRNKPCLDETDPDCPNFMAKEKGKKRMKKLDIGEILTGGCYGPAKKYMYWPEEGIIGGAKKNSSGFMKSAIALQTTIHFSNAEVFYNALNMRTDELQQKWTIGKAKQILREWKLALTKHVGRNNGSTRSKMLAFTTESFSELLKKLSVTDIKNIVIAVAIICCYSFITLRRFTTTIFSYGLLGFLAPLFICFSTVTGIGITYFLGIKSSSPISTEVLPLVSLSLSLNKMFLLLRTYVCICDAGNVSHEHIVPTCLGECGLSLTIASFIHTCGFLVGTTIPIDVLQRFCQQAAVVMVTNWFMLMFTLVPILCYDVDRLINKRIDCCCIKISDPEEESSTSDQTNNINLDDHFRCSFPYQQRTSSNHMLNKLNNDAAIFKLNRPRLQYNVTPQSFNENVSANNAHMGRCGTILQNISLNYVVQKYVTAWMTLKKVKVTIIFLFVVLLCTAAYGTTILKEELNLTEMVPKTNSQREFFIAQRKYFSYYNMQVITTELDYAKKQRTLREFFDRISQVDHVIKVESHEDFKFPQFWLDLFRKWLENAHAEFKKEWDEGKISLKCGPNCFNATITSNELFRLLYENNLNRQKSPCPRFLVKNGIINSCLFYDALSLWFNMDYLGAPKVLIKPDPQWILSKDHLRIKFVTNSFKVHGLQTTKQYLDFIRNIRGVCDEFKAKGINSYPYGMPFKYWEQFVVLNDSLIKAGSIVLLIVFMSVLIFFMSIKAAILVLAFTITISFELYGFIGLLGLSFNAVPAVVLIMSIGMGVEYSIHTVLAFVNTPGDRNTRMKAAIEITFVSSVDGILSTLIMMCVLSYSQYEFVTKYFFNLLVCLITIIAFNSLFTLPVILSFFGPCCEVTRRAIVPAIPPVFVITITPEQHTHVAKKRKRRLIRKSPDLTTISECSERLSSAESNASNRSRCRAKEDFRSGTPTVRYNKSDVFIEDYDDDDDNHHERQCCQKGRETRNSNKSDCSNDTNSNVYLCSQCNKETHNAYSNNSNYSRSRQSPHRTTTRQKCNNNSYEVAGRGGAQPRVIEVEENRHTVKVKASFEIEIPHSVGIGTSRYNQNVDKHFTPVD